jgi:hypothetical protein
MNETGKKALNDSPPSRTDLILETDEGELETIENVADVAEVAPGRLMVASLSGDREMVGGRIFGAYGQWKMWHETGDDTEQFLAAGPITMPDDFTQFLVNRDGEWMDHARSGRIKRLKRADL